MNVRKKVIEYLAKCRELENRQPDKQKDLGRIEESQKKVLDIISQ